MKSLFLLYFVTLSLFSTVAVAGPKQGGNGSGGGTSIVCRDEAGAVETAKLYDLFEAENDPVKPIEIYRDDSLEPMDRIRFAFTERSKRVGETIVDKNRPEIPADIQRALNLVKRDWVSLKAGTRLPLVTDVKPVFLSSGKNCELETTAIYDDNAYKLYVDMEIYNKLSNTDKAGLILHEAIYKNHRVLIKDETSTWVRKIVAGVLSKEFLSEKSMNQLGVYILSVSEILSINPRRSIEPDPNDGSGVADSHKVLDVFLGTKKLTCTLDKLPNEKIEVGIYQVNENTSIRSWAPYMIEPEQNKSSKTAWVFDYALRNCRQTNDSNCDFAIYGLTNADPNEKDPEFSGSGYAPVLKISGAYHMGELFAGRETVKGIYQIVTYKEGYEVKKVFKNEPVTCSLN